MISPFTAPGAKVVCIKLPTKYIENCWNIKLNEVYAVAEIQANEEFTNNFMVILQELDQCEAYGLELFRRLDLPECLTSLLNVQPVEREKV